MTKVTRLTINDGADGRGIHLREIAEDAEAPLETVGQDLRTARLRRGDDLATVSRALKIRRDHLEAIEEDRLEALPGRAYAIGFVRSYADYLGLDQALFVERFKAEIVDRTEPSVPVQVIEEDEQRQLPQGWLAIAGAVVLVLFYGVYHYFIASPETATPTVSPLPSSVSAASKPVRTPSQRQAVRTARNANSNAVKPPPARVTDENLAENTLPPGPSAKGGSASVDQQPVPSLKPSDSAPAVNQSPGGTLPAGQTYGLQNRNPRVLLRVHVPTRLLVLGPNKMIYINRTLKPGDVYQVPNQNGLTLTTPNGGAVEIDLDGAEMGFAGKAQQTTEALSLDPQAIADRYSGTRG